MHATDNLEGQCIQANEVHCVAQHEGRRNHTGRINESDSAKLHVQCGLAKGSNFYLCPRLWELLVTICYETSPLMNM
jgi:hypothetical protein